MEVPKYNELMFPVVRAITALGGSGSREEIRDQVASDLGLSSAAVDLQLNEGSGTVLDMRLSWALSYLKAGNVVSNSERGVWTLLERGRSLKPDDVHEIQREYRAAAAQRRREREAAQVSDAIVAEDSALLPDLGDGVSRDWRAALLAVLQKMPADAFERLCQRVLRESKFQRVEVTGKSGDGGIDGFGELEVGLISFRVVFQAKRWKGTVGSSVVRDFRGAMMGRADKGLIITTGTFTADARKEANRDGPTPIDLFDGERLCELLKVLRLGVEVQMVEEVSVQEEFFMHT